MTTEQIGNITYLTYKRMYDAENGTDYAQRHVEMIKRREQRERDEQRAHDRITYNNGTQRNVIGNYNDNNVTIEKSFNHLNSLKRALTLSQQTDNETSKMFHENVVMRELLALELTMRTMKSNIKRDNEQNEQ